MLSAIKPQFWLTLDFQQAPVDLAAQGFEVGHIFDSLVDSEIARIIERVQTTGRFEVEGFAIHVRGESATTCG
jgi:hypothetical protein